MFENGNFLPYGSFEIFVPADHFARSALEAGAELEPNIGLVFKKFVKFGNCVVDIGANIGLHTLHLSSLVGSGGTVYAVEADIDNVFFLNKSLKKNGLNNVSVLPVAASDSSRALSLSSSSGTNSIFSQSNDGALRKLACAVRLDDVIQRPVNFIKMDIEGAELLALRGLSSIMRYSRPIIISEYSRNYIINNLGFDGSEEFLSLIFDHGYGVYYIGPDSELAELQTWNDVVSKQEEVMQSLGWTHIDILCLPRGIDIR